MRRLVLLLAVAALVVHVAAPAALAQQAPPGWQTETNPPQLPLPAPVAPPAAPAVVPQSPLLPNTTIVPRTSGATSSGGPAQVSLVAVLTEDGQNIEQGLVWRIYRDKPGPDGKPRLVSTHREPSPSLRLDAGDYMINVAFGRTHLTRKISVTGERPAVQERFVLNAGGLRMTPVLINGEAAGDRAVVFDVLSDERDKHGQRMKVITAAKPGVILRLNAGIYSIISTYGDANAVARADVTVEAGKLTEVTLRHPAARVTFKLVTRAGGDAIADAQWNIAAEQGDPVKDSVGALPTHVLAPGTYIVSAKHAGQVFQHQFTVRAGETRQIEVVMR